MMYTSQSPSVALTMVDRWICTTVLDKDSYSILKIIMFCIGVAPVRSPIRQTFINATRFLFAFSKECLKRI